MEKLENLPVYYTNAINIRVSLFDILLELGKMYPNINPETKDLNLEFNHELSVFMSPQHFKEFVKILNNHLVKYEEKFGIINEIPKIKKENE